MEDVLVQLKAMILDNLILHRSYNNHVQFIHLCAIKISENSYEFIFKKKKERRKKKKRKKETKRNKKEKKKESSHSYEESQFQI